MAPAKPGRKRVPRRQQIEKHTQDALHHPCLPPHQRLTDPLPATLDPEAFVQSLVASIGSDEESALGPFYRALCAGRVTLEGARLWIKQWYFEARTFPPLVAQVIASCDLYYDVRQLIGANLLEELGELNPQREHPQLLKKIGNALGVSDAEMEFAQPIPEVLIFVDFRHKLVRDGNFLEALAAGLLAVELAIPGRYRKIGKALKEQFNISHDALEFLWLHAGDPTRKADYGGDVEHAAEATGMIKKYATSAGMQDRVRLALWRSLEARKVYQWGLYRACVLDLDAEFQTRYPDAKPKKE